MRSKLHYLNSEFLRGIFCIRSHRRKSFLSTIRHMCFQIPFIFPRPWPILWNSSARTASGGRDSSTSPRPSSGGGIALWVATAGWLVSLLNSTCEVWAGWSASGHTHPTTCSSQQLKDWTLFLLGFRV